MNVLRMKKAAESVPGGLQHGEGQERKPPSAASPGDVGPGVMGWYGSFAPIAFFAETLNQTDADLI